MYPESGLSRFGETMAKLFLSLCNRSNALRAILTTLDAATFAFPWVAPSCLHPLLLKKVSWVVPFPHKSVTHH